jgi:hypothetical protein
VTHEKGALNYDGDGDNNIGDEKLKVLEDILDKLHQGRAEEHNLLYILQEEKEYSQNIFHLISVTCTSRKVPMVITLLTLYTLLFLNKFPYCLRIWRRMVPSWSCISPLTTYEPIDRFPLSSHMHHTSRGKPRFDIFHNSAVSMKPTVL